MWLADTFRSSCAKPRTHIPTVTPSVDTKTGYLRFYDSGQSAATAVRSLIQQVYGHRYQATIREWAPTLVTLHEGADIRAAAGFRRAAQHTLFLERYLDRPIEEYLFNDDGSRPLRHDIVEVGHLAATGSGYGRRLILQLAEYFVSEQVPWVVATATQELHHLFLRLGLAPQVLGPAQPQRLDRNQITDWGSYYEHMPVILAGYMGLANAEESFQA